MKGEPVVWTEPMRCRGREKMPDEEASSSVRVRGRVALEEEALVPVLALCVSRLALAAMIKSRSSEDERTGKTRWEGARGLSRGAALRGEAVADEDMEGRLSSGMRGWSTSSSGIDSGVTVRMVVGKDGRAVLAGSSRAGVVAGPPYSRWRRARRLWSRSRFMLRGAQRQAAQRKRSR